MINYKYINRPEVINASNISKFIINARDRRNIKPAVVKNLIRELQAGNHFSAPLVVNEIDDEDKMIDGNHRLEAIKECIAQDKNFSIRVSLLVYRDLTEQEERDVYSLFNKGSVQSAKDVLKMYLPTIPLAKEILRRLPTTVYGDKTHLGMTTLVGCQINQKKNNMFGGAYSGTRTTVVTDFQAVNSDDVDKLEDFVNFMKECFGKFEKKTNDQFYQTTPLSVFYRIWADNQSLGPVILEKAFKKVFATNPQIWSNLTRASGITGSSMLYDQAISQLNRFKKTIHFKNDEEALAESARIARAISPRTA